MLKVQIFGCGAAGNKAVIELNESGLVTKDEMSFILINSTAKDIRPEYRTTAMIFGNGGAGGCGKERELGKRMILEDKENGLRSLDDDIDYDADFIIVCGSTEGGSGSASIPILTKYISQVHHKPVIAILFFGFNDDARGMQNSIEVCQELEDDIGVIAICNSAFMEPARGNKLEAEVLANREFCHIVRILVGKDIYESTQNIDDTDLKKVVTTPGYMVINKFDLMGGIRSVEQSNAYIEECLNDPVYMEPSVKSAKRIAAIFTCKKDSRDSRAVDYSCGIIKERFGIPYELFTHVQEVDNEFNLTVIVSGLKLPLDAVKQIYEEYKKTTAAINKDSDEFFNELGALRGDPQDVMFNMFSNDKSKSSIEEDKDEFFKSFGIDLKPSSAKKTVNKVKDVTKDY